MAWLAWPVVGVVLFDDGAVWQKIAGTDIHARQIASSRTGGWCTEEFI
jgi:hypothetical protein